MGLPGAIVATITAAVQHVSEPLKEAAKETVEVLRKKAAETANPYDDIVVKFIGALLGDEPAQQDPGNNGDQKLE